MSGSRLRDGGWTTTASSAFALAGFLALVLAAFTVLAAGPLVAYDAYLNLEPPPQSWVPVLRVLDRVGQRAVALPVLAVTVLWIWRRTRSPRPAVTAALSVLALNLVVGGLKVWLGRVHPQTGDPSFFSGGTAYPSGHAANVVLVYGLAVYLVSRHLRPTRRTVALSWGGVAVLSVTLVTASLTLNWHWFADLVAGLLVGGIVLLLTEAVDQLVPVDPAGGGRLSARTSRARGRTARARRSSRPPHDAG